MRVLFDNVSFQSNSGPNSFGLKLATALSKRGHVLAEAHEQPDVQLSFIQATRKVAPLIQRIDGIWFNTKQDWRTQNIPIYDTYKVADHVVVQSDFDRKLVEKFFGLRSGVSVVHNGTDIDFLLSVEPLYAPSLQGVDRVWSCASSWRPHKRLAENIRYFMEHATSRDVLVIAGENPDVIIADPRIFYAGNLNYQMLASLYRTTDIFLHLAWLDHCPNVVVDAAAAGCHVICSSAGGTSEIVGENSTIIIEDEWDFEPCELYNPPAMDFSKKRLGAVGPSLDINSVAAQYEVLMESVV